MSARLSGPHRSNSLHHLLRYLSVLILSIVSAGCMTPYGSLEGVVVEDEALSGAELRNVRIIREGSTVPPELNMVLLKNDEIITAADTRVILHVLDDAYEVTLGEQTEIRLENPSIFVRIGRVFYSIRKRLEEIREELEVENEFATAGAEGTEFLFAVNAAEEVKVAVMDGAVRVSPKGDSSWAPVVYRALEQGVIRRTRPPERMPDLSIEDADSLTAWAREADRLTTIEIPSVIGMRESAAVSRLQDQNLVPGQIERRVTGEAGAGTVISQEPAAGSAHRIGDAVTLVVEDGRHVPDLSGATRREAERRLRRAGLRVGEVSEERSRRTPGTVIEQSPAAGTLAGRSERVDLVLAGGCVVPDLHGLTERAVRARLRQEGLSLGQVMHLESGDTVTQQEPEAGQGAECGSTVDITVGVVG